jgi:hypothetical protein
MHSAIMASRGTDLRQPDNRHLAAAGYAPVVSSWLQKWPPPSTDDAPARTDFVDRPNGAKRSSQVNAGGASYNAYDHDHGARFNRAIGRTCPVATGTILLATMPASLSGSSNAAARPASG